MYKIQWSTCLGCCAPPAPDAPLRSGPPASAGGRLRSWVEVSGRCRWAAGGLSSAPQPTEPTPAHGWWPRPAESRTWTESGSAAGTDSASAASDRTAAPPSEHKQHTVTTNTTVATNTTHSHHKHTNTHRDTHTHTHRDTHTVTTNTKHTLLYKYILFSLRY